MIKRGFSRLKACARVKVRSQRRRSGKTSFSNVGALKAISFEALCNVRDRSSAHKTRFKPVAYCPNFRLQTALSLSDPAREDRATTDWLPRID